MKFIKKILSQTTLHNIWFCNNDNNLAFNLPIYIYDLKYNNINFTITGYFPDGPFRQPILKWSKIDNQKIYKPCPLSYHAGGEYDDNIGRWLDSTLIENTIENLFYTYLLAQKHNVNHLISNNWDELFYTRSFFTKDGIWSPAVIKDSDKFLNYIKNEIYFFGELKVNIYKEIEFFKLYTTLSPIQNKFVNNLYVISLLQLIKKFNDIPDFESYLFDNIFSYIPDNNIYKTLWKLNIFKWKMTKQDLTNHFLEFNKIKYLNLF